MTYKLIYLARRAATVSRDDWPRTWKSHAIFASQFPVLESKIEWMRYCNRIDQPTLDGEPVDVPFLVITSYSIHYTKLYEIRPISRDTWPVMTWSGAMLE